MSQRSKIRPVDLGASRPAFDDEFADLASAVSALTSDDLSGLSDSLNAADAWDVDNSAVSRGCGILANQF